MDTKAQLLEILKNWAKDAQISDETKLSDFSLDSLDIAEIVFEVEDKFHIQLDKADMEIADLDIRGLCRLIDTQRSKTPG
jgi:acyl carrier protein